MGCGVREGDTEENSHPLSRKVQQICENENMNSLFSNPNRKSLTIMLIICFWPAEIYLFLLLYLLCLAFGVELNGHVLWAEELYVWKHWHFGNFFFIFLYFLFFDMLYREVS
jgi:hypothetical protein